jgi:hypothetical protein
MPVGMHPDYGNNRFILENGDFVAVWQTYKFDLYQDYDPIKNIGSFIDFKLDKNRDTGVIDVYTESDKLTAYLPKDIKQIYDNLRADKTKEDILMTILAVPILMEGLHYMKTSMLTEEEIDLSMCRQRRWFRSLEKKLTDMHIDIKSEENMFVIAQKIFENPCRKSGLALEQIDEKQY